PREQRPNGRACACLLADGSHPIASEKFRIAAKGCGEMTLNLRRTQSARWFAPVISAKLSPGGNGLWLFLGRVVQTKAFQFAVQGRTPDPQAAGDFRHLPAVVRDRESDQFALDFLKRTDLSAGVQKRQRAVTVRRKRQPVEW